MDLLAQAIEGIHTVAAKSSLKEQAARYLRQWLTQPGFASYRPQLEWLIRQQQWPGLLDRFYQILPFGTGGRRGPVGKTGPCGKTGERGAKGDAPEIVGWHLEPATYRAFPVLSDGRMGAELNLRPLFEQFCDEAIGPAADAAVVAALKDAVRG